MKEEGKKSKGFLLDFIIDSLRSDEERTHHGDDLGIFIYLSSWFFIILLSSFSTDQAILNLNSFYILFDVIALLYIIVFIGRKFLHREEKGIQDLFTFPNWLELLKGLSFIFMMYAILLIYSISQNVFLGNGNTIVTSIFSIFRVVPTEELVFRGLGMFLISYILTGIFNEKKAGRKEWIAYLSVLITGIMFGIYHLPKYFMSEIFPYTIISMGEEDFMIHVAYPITYLCVLGVLLGLCKMKHGLYSAILLHALNNALARISLTILAGCFS